MGNTNTCELNNESSQKELINTITKIKKSGVSNDSCLVKKLDEIATLTKNTDTTSGSGSGSGSKAESPFQELLKNISLMNLKSKWEKDKNDYNNLPDIINSDEKKYYIEKEGEEYYTQNILINRYTNIFNTFKDNEEKKINNIRENISNQLKNYTSAKLAEKRVNELYIETLQTNKALKKDIDNFYKEVLTDERKVYYENKENDNIKFYNKIILIVYYILLGIYILFGPFISEKKYKNILIWFLIILYIIIPFFLKYLISFILNLIVKNESVIDPTDNNKYYIINKNKNK